MLKKLNIQNFKCFLNQDIDFGKITVLAGANGVGKSTVVQSLLLIRRVCEIYPEQKTLIINDKENSFMELNNTQEVLNSQKARGEKIVFKCFDSQNGYQLVELLNQNLSQTFGLNAQNTFQKSLIEPFEEDKMFQYLNAERLGPRNVLNTKETKHISVGFQGELTGYAIAKSERRTQTVHENKLFPESKNYNFRFQVEKWLDYLIPDVKINIDDKLIEYNLVRIGLRKQGSETDFLHPNNIGFGISYVLPIIVAGLIAEEGSMLIVENPEAHLHPSGQSRIGQFLAKMAGAGVQVVVETHSEHVINGIRLASLKNWVEHNEVIINFFSQEKKGEVKVEKIELNELSDLTKWPVGFFDQAQRDVLEIMQLKKNKQK